LSGAELRQLFAERPECFFGFTEWDAPNFTFRDAAHTFFSGTKALAEEVIRGSTRAYVWRPGIPFDDRNEAGNLLAQSPGAATAAGIASLTHVGDFVRACLNLWERQATPGTYNIANPGAVALAARAGANHPAEFYDCAGQAVRSHSLLDGAKLRAAGLELRPVTEAWAETLDHWRGTPAMAAA
jgi:nucleoside-diphosphate-sugar epimerase